MDAIYQANILRKVQFDMAGTSRFGVGPGVLGLMMVTLKKMPGHMGNKRVTIRNLKVIKIDEAKNLLYIKGAIPGARRGMVVIKKSNPPAGGPKSKTN